MFGAQSNMSAIYTGLNVTIPFMALDVTGKIHKEIKYKLWILECCVCSTNPLLISVHFLTLDSYPVRNPSLTELSITMARSPVAAPRII